jgi:hypothetical protein
MGTNPYSNFSSGRAPELQIQRVRGKVQSTHEIHLPGLDEGIEIALLQSNQGQPVIVVLGPEESLNEIQLKKGSTISVRGQECNVGNHEVILAQQVTVDGQTVQAPWARAHMQRIQGEVTNTAQVKIPGLRQTILAAEVTASSGQPAIVVLGPVQDLQGNQPKDGDQISIRGEAVRINGQTVLLGRSLALNGRTVELNGSQQPGPFSQQQGQFSQLQGQFPQQPGQYQ